jgi:hypothetical protein
MGIEDSLQNKLTKILSQFEIGNEQCMKMLRALGFGRERLSGDSWILKVDSRFKEKINGEEDQILAGISGLRRGKTEPFVFRKNKFSFVRSKPLNNLTSSGPLLIFTACVL